MIINIHPSAADNYNKKAGELLEFIIEYPPNRERQEEFSSHLHVAGSFTDKNIIGEIEVSSSDYKGNTISRSFHLDGKNYGLSEGSYKKLKNIAEKLQLLPGIRNTLSCSFVEKSLFNWLSNKYKKVGTSQSYVEFVNDHRLKAGGFILRLKAVHFA